MVHLRVIGTTDVLLVRRAIGRRPDTPPLILSFTSCEWLCQCGIFGRDLPRHSNPALESEEREHYQNSDRFRLLEEGRFAFPVAI